VLTGATFESTACRLLALREAVDLAAAQGGLGSFATVLQRQVAKGLERTEEAEARCAIPSLRKSRAWLGKAIRTMATIGRVLDSRKARRTIDPAVRDPLRSAVDGLRTDLQALRRALRCP
jgi:hypothetical protein